MVVPLPEKNLRIDDDFRLEFYFFGFSKKEAKSEVPFRRFREFEKGEDPCAFFREKPENQ